MDDYIDDLIAEIEGTMGGAAAPTHAAPVVSGPTPANLGRAPVSASFDDDDDDLDALLNSVESTVGAARSTPALVAPQRSLASVPPTGVGARAAPSALSSAPPRVAGLSYGRTAMRCTRCDFRVLRFVDRAWADGVDYMFFRNFMPDAARMLSMLHSQQASDAFACQCLWATVERDDALPHPQWRIRETLVADDLIVG